MPLSEDSYNLVKQLYESIKKSVNDDDTDLVTNTNNSLWIKNIEGIWREEPNTLNEYTIRTLGEILAGNLGTALNSTKPFLDCAMPYDGSRINILVPPASEIPTIAIRFHREQFRNLEALVKTKMLSEEQAQLLTNYVKEKKTIIISGETGSGKTTLLSALANEIDKNQRIVVIEDTREITIHSPNVQYILTGTFFSGEDAIHNVLRLTPDRIIYGEVRGSEAIQLLKAWNTGHKGGLGTIHANSVADIKIRLDDCCKENNNANMTRTIETVLDIGVQIERDSEGHRYIAEIKNFKE